MKYVVITPVKDEARYFERTLRSMVAQTRKPIAWIIVDDGSSDGCLELAKAYAEKWEFIKSISRGVKKARQTGVAEIHVFNVGYELVRGLDFDVIVKLDADLDFDPSYFDGLVREFESDPKLGVASGVYFEECNGAWIEVRMPGYHACGASKALRRECFEQIGGFATERGWDTLDEIQAMARGWQTTHFRNLRLNHLKPEGSSMGQIHTATMHGEIFHRTGGGLLFFMVKFVRRLSKKPFVVGALAMAWGFVRSMLSRRPLLVTPDEGRVYRQRLRSRIAPSS